MLNNYHTHTRRCGHANGTDREYVEAAIEMGIRKLGFSDHTPWISELRHGRHAFMSLNDMGEYISSINKLRDEYASDIDIYVGLEEEYIEEWIEEQDAYFADHGYELDYRILGQHFMGVRDGMTLDEYSAGDITIYTGVSTTSEDYLSYYVDSVIRGMSSGRYLYLAHPDLIKYEGPTRIYDKYMYRICESMKGHKLPLEINRLGLSEGRHYPMGHFFELAADVGNDVVIGMDAHSPEQLKDTTAYERCLEMAHRYGLNVVNDTLELSRPAGHS